MSTRKILFSVSLAGGLLLAPLFSGAASAQNGLPDRETLNSIARGEAPAPQPSKKLFRNIEKALKQNMTSAEALIKAAKAAGASPKALAEMENYSVGFLKSFLTAFANGAAAPSKQRDEQRPPERKPVPLQKSPGAAPGSTPPDVAPAPGFTPPPPPVVAPRQTPPAPQGIIITAPDGTQWLVTPQTGEPGMSRPPKARPEKRRHARPENAREIMPKPDAANDAAPQTLPTPATPPVPDEVIIIEEETVSDMPLWPTKDQMSKDGILKYLEKRNAR